MTTPTFRSEHVIPGDDSPPCYVVRLDRSCTDFRHLVDKLVSIDGALYRCLSVLRYDLGPWVKGDTVGLIASREDAPTPN